ncbi:MAG: PDZ domain-containing protein [Pseudomonadota bacterium]
MNGAPVNSPGEMLYRMSVASVSDTAQMTRLRDGAVTDLTVALIPPPDVPPRDEITLPEGTSLPGLTVARVNPAVLAELNLPIAAQGVVVLEPGQVGRRVGLRRGDVLDRINRQRIADPVDAANALAAARRGTTVRLTRGNGRVMLRF